MIILYEMYDMMDLIQAEIDQETPPLYSGWTNLRSMTCCWLKCIL